MGHDVFISYSSSDKSATRAVLAALEGSGVRCWMAPRDILGGQEYAKAIVAAISQARAVVLVFSARADRSPQVLREVERAVSRGLPIVTFRIDGTDPTGSFEYFLGACHWLDGSRSPTTEQLEQLALSAKSHLGTSAGGPGSRKMARGAPKSRRKVPRLLPYMADRQQQEERFAQELAGRLQRRTPAPIVYVIHGEEDQCHDKFIDRLRRRLPTLLDEPSPPLSCRLDCRCPAPDPAVLASRWSSNLGQMFGLKPGAAAEDVSRAIAAGSAAVLIDANFWSTDWRNGARPVFDALLHFLENWPSFPEGAKVVACICVSYVRGQGLFHRYRCKRLCSAMQRHIRSLETPGSYPRTAPSVLPPLENVSLAQALHWAMETNTRRFCADDALRDALQDRVRSLYADRQIAPDGQTIPMKLLASRLKEILSPALEKGM